jgi:hypothetical protein
MLFWTSRGLLRALAIVAIAASGRTNVHVQGLLLADVMRKVHGFVVEYEDYDLSTIVAKEHYEQVVLDDSGGGEQRRVLTSDYWVFQLPPEESWFAIRDVYEVDGQPVRERRDRLQQTFRLEPSEDAFERAMEIAKESARFNIGDVVRTMNVPTFALAFLRPSNRERMHFVKLGEESLDGISTWVIGYREIDDGGPTFITTPDGDNLLTRGRFWVDPVVGRVVQSELITGDGRVSRTVRITVRYRPDSARGLWLPAEMNEVYESTDTGRWLPIITGTATYSNYRIRSVPE